MSVYFLRPIGMPGPVKIGCSIMPHWRMYEYMTWSPFPLEIAAEGDGDFNVERALHLRFAGQRTHREWFSASPDLTALIDHVKFDSDIKGWLAKDGFDFEAYMADCMRPKRRAPAPKAVA